MSTTVFDRPVAHRGYHDRQRGVIENSAAAFEAAIAKGFGIECDLQLTRDGEVMAKVLAKKSGKKIELQSVNPAYPPRSFEQHDIEWMHRIVWAQQ